MNTPTTPIATRTLDGALAAFLRAQEGKNRRPATLAAYRTDLAQFVAWGWRRGSDCDGACRHSRSAGPVPSHRARRPSADAQREALA